jgi:hypothetical protein
VLLSFSDAPNESILSVVGGKNVAEKSQQRKILLHEFLKNPNQLLTWKNNSAGTSADVGEMKIAA